MINKIKKLKLPVIVGLILGGLDLAVWVLFLTYSSIYLSEGLMLMMVLHIPASILLPLLGGVIIMVFNQLIPGSVDYLLPQTLFLLIVGVAQYYFLGYFVGWLINVYRRKRGYYVQKLEKREKKTSGRKSAWIYNSIYLLFTILILQMLADIISGMVLDFELYKVNYPPARHYLEAIIFILWFYSTYRIIRHNKKNETVKNANRVLLIIGILIAVICSGIYIPKWSKTDISGVTSLEGLYARQQAKIFFDNPLERFIVMKTAIVGMDEKMYQVTAYTFFGLKYRVTDIEKVSEYEMHLLLNPAMQKRQYEAQTGVTEILKRIEHPQWSRVTYSRLIRNNSFSPEKIQGAIPGINDANSLFLKTDYNEHEVYLLIYMEDTFTNHFRKDSFVFEDIGPHPKYIINSKEVKISKAHSDSVLDSYRIDLEDHPYYIIFDVVSDQKPPADLDYIWDPDHNVNDKDILQILKSIAGSQKEYLNDNLKLSFAYPDNFYIENYVMGQDIVVTPYDTDDPNRNTDGFAYTSLKMKKISKGEEYQKLMNDFHKKSQDKEPCLNYSQEDLSVNGKLVKEIKYVFPFSGGMDVNMLLDAGDYILHISYYDDIAYVDEYKQIIDSIAVWSSITE